MIIVVFIFFLMFVLPLVLVELILKDDDIKNDIKNDDIIKYPKAKKWQDLLN